MREEAKEGSEETGTLRMDSIDGALVKNAPMVLNFVLIKNQEE